MDILDAHKKLLAEQKKRRPSLTIREMAEVVGVSSTSYMIFILNKLEHLGLAKKESRGSYHVYYLEDGE